MDKISLDQRLDDSPSEWIIGTLKAKFLWNSLSKTIHSLGKKCTKIHSTSNWMARPTSKSLELSKVNSSSTRLAGLGLTNNYKVHQLTDFGFVVRVGIWPTTPKSISPWLWFCLANEFSLSDSQVIKPLTLDSLSELTFN